MRKAKPVQRVNAAITAHTAHIVTRSSGQRPCVSILCTTFNQEQYLRDALEGFLLQKTTFPFEVIIHDDASTDGTAAVVEEYLERFPDVTYVREKTNCYSRGLSVARSLREICSGKYIAYCEGDDYWISEAKLQRQYDFMESHGDFAICLHNAVVADLINRSAYLSEPDGADREKSVTELIAEGGGRVNPTASFFVRKEALNDVALGPVEDHFIMLSALEHGRAFWIARPLSVYRYGALGSFTLTGSAEGYEKIRAFNVDYAAALRSVRNHFERCGVYGAEIEKAFANKLTELEENIDSALAREELLSGGVSILSAAREKGLSPLVAIKVSLERIGLFHLMAPAINYVKRLLAVRRKKQQGTYLGRYIGTEKITESWLVR